MLRMIVFVMSFYCNHNVENKVKNYRSTNRVKLYKKKMIALMHVGLQICIENDSINLYLYIYILHYYTCIYFDVSGDLE